MSTGCCDITDILLKMAFNTIQSMNSTEIVLCTYFNTLPHHKILDGSNLKAFKDNNFFVIKIIISVCDRVKNIVGKGENAGLQHFLHFPTMFSKAFCR